MEQTRNVLQSENLCKPRTHSVHLNENTCTRVHLFNLPIMWQHEIMPLQVKTIRIGRKCDLCNFNHSILETFFFFFLQTAVFRSLYKRVCKTVICS